MAHRRRRFDSDDELDEPDVHAGDGAPSILQREFPSEKSRGAQRKGDDTNDDSGDVTVEVGNDLLLAYGVDDLVEAPRGRAASVSSSANSTNSSDDNYEEVGTSGSNGAAATAAAVATASPIAGMSSRAAISVKDHVRKRPRGEAAADTTTEAFAVRDAAAEAPELYAANEVYRWYRPAKSTAKGNAAAQDDHPLMSSPSDVVPSVWPNRFGIRPGWRWDGVVRGTGAEERFFSVR